MPQATHIEVCNTLTQCPQCGYRNGFHVGLQRVEPNGSARKYAVQFICPSCSTVFDIGLTTSLQAGLAPQPLCS